MVLLAIIGLALIGLAASAAAWGLVLPYARSTARLQQISAYGFAQPGVGLAARERHPSVLVSAANRLGDALSHGHLKRYEDWLRRRLVAAAVYNVSARAVMGAQFLAAAVFTVLILLVGVGGSLSRTVPFALFAGVSAWLLPAAAVNSRARRRLDDIDRQTPDLIDMLVVTLEGGLGFGASLDAASTRMPAPIGDEIRLTMQEHRMGLTIAESLAHFLSRVDTPNTQSFVRSVTQGETLGVSMGTIMRNLAEEMRVRRRQAAEERAQKAPVKMLFPLIFLMFPALGVVILGPALFEITDTLGGGL